MVIRLLLCLGALLLVAEAAHARTWKDKTGQFQVEAEFVASSSRHTFLKAADGRIIVVPDEKLSVADHKYIRDLLYKERRARGRPEDVTAFLKKQPALDFADLPFQEVLGALFSRSGHEPVYLGESKSHAALITVKAQATNEQMVDAACKAVKLEWEAFPRILVIGDAAQLKAHRAFRERAAAREKALAADKANEVILAELENGSMAEFVETPAEEVLAFLTDLHQVPCICQKSVSEKPFSMNFHAPLESVLDIMAMWSSGDWTTDGRLIYFGSPEGIAKLEKVFTGRPARRKAWPEGFAKRLDFKATMEVWKTPLSEVCKLLEKGQAVKIKVDEKDQDAKISLHIKGIPCELALDAIAFQLGLEWIVAADQSIVLSRGR